MEFNLFSWSLYFLEFLEYYECMCSYDINIIIILRLQIGMFARHVKLTNTSTQADVSA